MHAKWDMFWWRRQELRLCDVNTNVCDSPNKKCFPFKSSHYPFFLISLFVSFCRYSFQYRRNSVRHSTQLIIFCRISAVETIICLGPCTFTLRGLRFVDVGIIYLILGKVLFQISFTNYENILAHNTAMVTSGNSGLPRLNSSRKSSDTPLSTQSPIWVNPMGPIPLSFDKKCYNVTTPGNNSQISSTKRAFVECMFLLHRLRSLHQGYFPDLIDCRSVFMSTKLVLSRVHVLPVRSVSMTLLRCAVWRKQTSARSSRPIKVGQNPHDNWIM